MDTKKEIAAIFEQVAQQAVTQVLGTLKAHVFEREFRISDFMAQPHAYPPNVWFLDKDELRQAIDALLADTPGDAATGKD